MKSKQNEYNVPDIAFQMYREYLLYRNQNKSVEPESYAEHWIRSVMNIRDEELNDSIFLEFLSYLSGKNYG